MSGSVTRLSTNGFSMKNKSLIVPRANIVKNFTLMTILIQILKISTTTLTNSTTLIILNLIDSLRKCMSLNVTQVSANGISKKEV